MFPPTFIDAASTTPTRPTLTGAISRSSRRGTHHRYWGRASGAPVSGDKPDARAPRHGVAWFSRAGRPVVRPGMAKADTGQPHDGTAWRHFDWRAGRALFAALTLSGSGFGPYAEFLPSDLAAVDDRRRAIVPTGATGRGDEQKRSRTLQRRG